MIPDAHVTNDHSNNALGLDDEEHTGVHLHPMSDIWCVVISGDVVLEDASSLILPVKRQDTPFPKPCHSVGQFPGLLSLQGVLERKSKHQMHF